MYENEPDEVVEEAPAEETVESSEPEAPAEPDEPTWSGEPAHLEQEAWFSGLDDAGRASVKSGYEAKVKNLERGWHSKVQGLADRRKEIEAREKAAADMTAKAEQALRDAHLIWYKKDDEQPIVAEREKRIAELESELSELRDFRTNRERADAERAALESERAIDEDESWLKENAAWVLDDENIPDDDPRKEADLERLMAWAQFARTHGREKAVALVEALGLRPAPTKEPLPPDIRAASGGGGKVRRRGPSNDVSPRDLMRQKTRRS